PRRAPRPRPFAAHGLDPGGDEPRAATFLREGRLQGPRAAPDAHRSGDRPRPETRTLARPRAGRGRVSPRGRRRAEGFARSSARDALTAETRTTEAMKHRNGNPSARKTGAR